MEVQYQRFNSNQSGNCSVTPLPLPQSLYGRTDGRTYGHVITKFSRLGGLPNFLTHGAPLARFARWSSAIILVCAVEGGCRDIASTICGQMSVKEIALLQN